MPLNPHSVDRTQRRSADDGDVPIRCEVDDDPPPFPWLQVVLANSILLVNNLSMMMLFPVLPFITQRLRGLSDRAEIGYWAGFLGASFSVGSLLGAYPWGRLSDRYGRKPTMIFGFSEGGF
jgi:MFS family permease